MSRGKPEFVGESGTPAFRGPGGPGLSRRSMLFAIVLAALVLAPVVVFNLCFEYVRPNEYGIKVIHIGVNRGVQEKIYPPGYAFRIPFGIEQIHRLPQNIQVLELTNYAGAPGEGAYVTKGAKIQTSDGFFVDVDATILYRIVDPYEVFTRLGQEQKFLELGMLPKSESVLKEALGQLTTEEFYDSQLRVAKAQLAREILNEKLANEGMEVEHVLVRYFEYSESIQQNIEDKKLQDQLVFTNESKGRAAEQRQVLMRTKEEGEYMVKVKMAEGDAYRVEKEAERDLYQRTKTAEADLLVARAEAEGVRMKNEAMQTLGANAMVAMRMAEVLEGLDTIYVPAGGEQGLNPLDLDGVLRMFGVARSDAPPVPLREPRPSTVPAPDATEEIAQ